MWNQINNFCSFISVGGVIMYPLTFIGVIIIGLGTYQLFWLALWNTKAKGRSDYGAPMWAKKALQMAQTKRGLTGLTLLESIELCLSRLEDCMTKRVPALRFLAQISTLIGFLGTVTGMVRVFNTVSKLGVVTPAELAGGIYEALFTTVYGLILSIIAWGFTWCIEALAQSRSRTIEKLIIRELEPACPDSKSA